MNVIYVTVRRARICARIKELVPALVWRRSFLVPRYYFHVRRGQCTVIDQEGIELANEIEAALEAARRRRAIATSDALKGILTGGGLIIVDDEWDNSVIDIPLDVC
jgi:Domain of unknown function (DUF6894)